MNSFARRGVENSAFTRMLKGGGRARPRTLTAALAGTAICFAAFVRHYEHVNDDSVVFVWFGMRSDGRCGRDFGADSAAETKCGKGQCCSAHGWCGHGEEYCSVALGCQNGCWPADPSRANDDVGHGGHGGDWDEGEAESMYHPHHGDAHNHFRYSDDVYDDGPPGAGSRGYHRGGGEHDDHHYDDYNHRYDDLHGEEEELADGEDDAPELVGLSEEQHLGDGDGDGVPLGTPS